MKTLLNTGLLVALLAVSGCHKSSTAGGVAVIDLDKVATSLGWMEELNKSIKTTDAELRTQLDAILKNSLTSIEEAKKQVAAAANLTPDQVKYLNNVKDERELDFLALSKEQREKLSLAVNKANTTWQNALNGYQQTLQSERAKLIVSYREKIRPAARRVATARGLSAVFTVSDNLIYFDAGSVDITEKVIDELQKNPPPAAAAAPAVNPSADSEPAK